MSICPTCQKEIDKSEVLDKIVENERYHLDCFICSKCQDYLGNDQKFFRDPETRRLNCASCYEASAADQKAGSRDQDGEDDGLEAGGSYKYKVPKVGGASKKCHACEEILYVTEQVSFAQHDYHRWCLKCTECSAGLAPNKAFTKKNKPICENCNFKTTHTSFQTLPNYDAEKQESGDNQSIPSVRSDASTPANLTISDVRSDRELLGKKGYDVTRLQDYLSANDFFKLFNLNMDEFYKLPAWQQITLKKKHGLF